MTNKKLWLKLGIFALSVGGAGLSFASAALLGVQIKGGADVLADYAKSNIAPIHFADNGNDFGGFIYISPLSGDSENPSNSGHLYYIGTGGDEPIYECQEKVKGYYYNSERGERLWPLDGEESGISGIIMTGGIYTSCRPVGYESLFCGCRGGIFSGSYEDGERECNPKNGVDDYGNWIPDECGDDEECKNAQKEEAERCEKTKKEYGLVEGYFGKVQHQYSGQTFGLVVGTTYEQAGMWYSVKNNGGIVDLQSSFIRFNGQFPLGFIYDYNGGLGFAGCQLLGDSTKRNGTLKNLVLSGNEGKLQEMFDIYYTGDNHNQMAIKPASGSVISDNAMNCDKIGAMGDSLINLIIEGLVGMNISSDFSKVGLQSDKKMQYFSSSDINSATLLNYARQRSEILCRGKWKTDISNLADKVGSDTIVCLNGENIEGGIGTGVASWAKDKGKTLVVKNADVTIDPFTDSDDTTYYDIFVNNGNLIVNETPETEKFIFNRQGFIAGATTGDFKKDMDSSIGAKVPYTGDYAAEASLLKGNFVVDGKIIGANNDKILDNKYFVYGKFTTKDSFDDLEKTFAWRCDGNTGKSSDGSYCPPSHEGWYNPYYNASLVVIDQSYDSPLYW